MAATAAHTYSPEQRQYAIDLFAKEDYYEILNVSEQATEGEIKSAFRQGALKVHPDKNPCPEADKAFKKLYEAYETLVDEKRRRRYDEGDEGDDDEDEEDSEYDEEDDDEESGGFFPFFAFGGSRRERRGQSCSCPECGRSRGGRQMDFDEMLFYFLNQRVHHSSRGKGGFGASFGFRPRRVVLSSRLAHFFFALRRTLCRTLCRQLVLKLYADKINLTSFLADSLVNVAFPLFCRSQSTPSTRIPSSKRVLVFSSPCLIPASTCAILLPFCLYMLVLAVPLHRAFARFLLPSA